MRRLGFTLSFAAVATALSGCWPAMVRHSPHVRGTVTVGERPASGAEIFVQSRANDACDASSLHSTADETGSFEVPTGRIFELDGVSWGDRGFGWSMCIVYQGQYFAAFRQMGWGYPPKKVQLACDLSAGAVPSSRPPFAPGICRTLDE